MTMTMNYPVEQREVPQSGTQLDSLVGELFGRASRKSHLVTIGWVLALGSHAAAALRGSLAGAVFHSDHGSQGGFNLSSQHRVVGLSVVGRQALPPVFSTRVSCGAGC